MLIELTRDPNDAKQSFVKRLTGRAKPERWSLTIEGEELEVRDPDGNVAATLTPQTIGTCLALPDMVQSRNLVIRIDDQPRKFPLRRKQYDALRRFAELALRDLSADQLVAERSKAVWMACGGGALAIGGLCLLGFGVLTQEHRLTAKGLMGLALGLFMVGKGCTRIKACRGAQHAAT